MNIKKILSLAVFALAAVICSWSYAVNLTLIVNNSADYPLTITKTDGGNLISDKSVWLSGKINARNYNTFDLTNGDRTLYNEFQITDNNSGQSLCTLQISFNAVTTNTKNWTSTATTSPGNKKYVDNSAKSENFVGINNNAKNNNICNITAAGQTAPPQIIGLYQTSPAKIKVTIQVGKQMQIINQLF